MKVVQSQNVEVTRGTAPTPDQSKDLTPHIFTRSQRAHWRLSWEQRLSRNARPASSPLVTLTLHGLPAAFARIYGFELRDAS
jgi:hypothetical protein